MFHQQVLSPASQAATTNSGQQQQQQQQQQQHFFNNNNNNNNSLQHQQQMNNNNNNNNNNVNNINTTTTQQSGTSTSTSTTQGAMPQMNLGAPMNYDDINKNTQQQTTDTTTTTTTTTNNNNNNNNNNATTTMNCSKQDKIMIPRSSGWNSDINSHPNKDGDHNKTEEEINALEKRGDYKCSKCGEPKRGHVCRNKPRVRAAYVEKRDASINCVLDTQMSISHLNRSLQGYPLSYGFNNTWPAVNPVNPFFQNRGVGLGGPMMPSPQMGGMNPMMMAQMMSGMQPQMGGGQQQMPNFNTMNLQQQQLLQQQIAGMNPMMMEQLLLQQQANMGNMMGNNNNNMSNVGGDNNNNNNMNMQQMPPQGSQMNQFGIQQPSSST